VYAYDDALSILDRVKSRYGTVGLVSNTIFPPRAHLRELDKFKLRSFFDFTIFSSTFGLRKPHPDIFYEASTRAGAAPGECVYIGDRYREDVEGPTRIGMNSILRFHPDREYPEDKLPSLRMVNSLSELDLHLDI
jgi:putative hydrolase of the HAD superfamily